MKKLILISFLVLLCLPSTAWSDYRSVLSDIKGSIADDPAIGQHEIDIRYHNGEVIIRGEVDSARAEQHIRQIAERTKGVDSVVLELKILPAAPQTRARLAPKPARSDDQIAQSISYALQQSPEVSAHGLTISVANGIASIAGERENFRQIDKILSVVLMVEGVQDIHSNMTISGSPYTGAWKTQAKS